MPEKDSVLQFIKPIPEYPDIEARNAYGPIQPYDALITKYSLAMSRRRHNRAIASIAGIAAAIGSGTMAATVSIDVLSSENYSEVLRYEAIPTGTSILAAVAAYGLQKIYECRAAKLKEKITKQ